MRQSRKAALELLLSDHYADCVGPCQLACPAGTEPGLFLRKLRLRGRHARRGSSGRAYALKNLTREACLPRVITLLEQAAA